MSKIHFPFNIITYNLILEDLSSNRKVSIRQIIDATTLLVVKLLTIMHSNLSMSR
jgi:hypothetical protein